MVVCCVVVVVVWLRGVSDCAVMSGGCGLCGLWRLCVVVVSDCVVGLSVVVGVVECGGCVSCVVCVVVCRGV